MEKIIFIVSFFFSIGLVAQDEMQNLNIPKHEPTAPDAAALWKFKDIPVNLSSGTTEISIPLLKITTGKFSLPITLAYNSSGIKVNEVATHVGLGWVLNAGGMISKTVMGEDDEITELYDVPNSFNSKDFYTNKFPNLSGIAQPDIYQYNLPNKSGRFIYHFNKTIKAATIPFDPIKIDHVARSDKFTITDVDGTIYEFGMPTGNIYETCLDTDVGSFNTWHLKKIVTSENRVIHFDYRVNSYVYEMNMLERKYKVHPPITNPSLIGPARNLLPQDILCKQTARVSDYILSEIIYDGGKVIFTHSDDLPIDGETTRRDLQGALALRNIKLVNNQQIIKSFNLEYSYFGPISSDPNDMRLKLNKLVEVNGENQNEEFKFFYEENSNLPNRLSYSQDHWGYFNGASNSSLIPSINENGYVHSGANREASSSSTQANILKKIVYPTQGSVSFEYEQNSYLKPAGQKKVQKSIRVNSEHDESYNPETDPVTEIDGYFNITNALYQTTNGRSHNVIFITDNECYEYDEEGNMMDGDGELSFIIYDLNDNYVLDISSAKTYYLNLPRGEYYVKAHRPFESDCYGGVSVFWQENEVVPPQNQFLGGLRISTVTTDDAKGKIETKRYKYNIPGTELSSGKTYFKKKYLTSSYLGTPGHSAGQSVFPTFEYITLNSNSTIASEGVQYEYVTEIQSGKGKIENKFHQQEVTLWPVEDQIDMYWDNVYNETSSVQGTFISDPYRRKGFYKYRKFYNEEDSLIMKKQYKYSFDGYPLDLGYGTNRYTIANGLSSNFVIREVNSAMAFQFETLKYGTYRIRSGWDKLIQEKETRYFKNDSVEVINDYEYSENSFQLKQITTKSSENNLQKIKYYYPQDRNELTGLSLAELNNYRRLYEQHRISEIIQTDIIKNDLITNRVRNTYNEFSPGIILQHKISSGTKENTVDSLEDRLFFHQYDDQSNLIEFSKADGIPVSYIWGYNQKYLVAKVENITRSDIEDLPGFGVNFHSGVVGLTTMQENTLRDLSDVMVTTYTYDPLIGVTSMTDPKGYTTYYEYDDFNRLEFVKDAEGKLISENKYNYKN